MTANQAINIAQSTLTREAIALAAQGDRTAAEQYKSAASVLSSLRPEYRVVIDPADLKAAKHDPQVARVLEDAREAYARSKRL